MNGRLFWTILVVLLVGQKLVHGLVWSLVLGNPVIDAREDDERLHEEDSSSSQEDDTSSTDRLHPHPRNTRFKLQVAPVSSPTGSRLTRQHHGQDKCLEDRQCGKGRFCDLHYGVCRTEKSPGFACRRDRMCAKGLACMFGRCQAKIPTGEEGSRCHSSSDCQAGLCCARRHGEAVCQRKLTLGQRCFVPDGGLEYSLNQLCPCDVGLVCRQQAPDPSGASNSTSSGNADGFPFWTSTDNMRCTFHDMVDNRTV